MHADTKTPPAKSRDSGVKPEAAVPSNLATALARLGEDVLGDVVERLNLPSTGVVDAVVPPEGLSARKAQDLRKAVLALDDRLKSRGNSFLDTHVGQQILQDLVDRCRHAPSMAVIAVEANLAAENFPRSDRSVRRVLNKVLQEAEAIDRENVDSERSPEAELLRRALTRASHPLRAVMRGQLPTIGEGGLTAEGLEFVDRAGAGSDLREAIAVGFRFNHFRSLLKGIAPGLARNSSIVDQFAEIVGCFPEGKVEAMDGVIDRMRSLKRPADPQVVLDLMEDLRATAKAVSDLAKDASTTPHGRDLRFAVSKEVQANLNSEDDIARGSATRFTDKVCGQTTSDLGKELVAAAFLTFYRESDSRHSAAHIDRLCLDQLEEIARSCGGPTGYRSILGLSRALGKVIDPLDRESVDELLKAVKALAKEIADVCKPYGLDAGAQLERVLKGCEWHAKPTEYVERVTQVLQAAVHPDSKATLLAGVDRAVTVAGGWDLSQLLTDTAAQVEVDQERAAVAFRHLLVPAMEAARNERSGRIRGIIVKDIVLPVALDLTLGFGVAVTYVGLRALTLGVRLMSHFASLTPVDLDWRAAYRVIDRYGIDQVRDASARLSPKDLRAVMGQDGTEKRTSLHKALEAPRGTREPAPRLAEPREPNRMARRFGLVEK